MKLHFVTGVLGLVFTLSRAVAAVPSAPTNPRIIDSFSPLGIDTAYPRFGWIDNDSDRGEKQTAYEVIVAANEADIDANSGTLWDSGKTSSSQQYGIVYAGAPLASTAQYWWKVRTWDKDDQVSPWSAKTRFVTGFLQTNDWNAGARWIGNPQATGPTNNPPSMFRKTFQVTKPVSQAYLYICGLGQFVSWLNGARVGNDEIDPAWTDYLHSVNYVTFDVTSQLQAGNNALGVMLGAGWFSYGTPATTGTYFYGTMRVLAQLHILYSDGTSTDIVTDPTWKASSSPFTSTDVFGLENYDARREQPGWNTAGFNDSAWAAAAAVSAPPGNLESQKSPPVTAHETYHTVSINNPASNVYVFDLGQNMNGQHEITVSGPAGSTVEIVPGEWLDSNGRVKLIKSYTHSLYTLKGSGTEVWRLTFSTVGFRYIEIRNATRNPAQTSLPYIQNVTGYATYTAASDVGTFYASDNRYNQIYTLALHTLQNNLVSIHTDCPTWEKLGWQEVVPDTFPSSFYRYDLQTLAAKIAKDEREGVRPEGYVPDVVPNWFSSYDPNNGYENAPSWGTAVFQLPWLIYWNYGDVAPLQENYPIMTNYLAYLKTKEVNGVVTYGLGDYLAPAGPQIANVEGAAYVLSARTTRDAATVLGYTADVTYYSNEFNRVRNAYNNAYFDSVHQWYVPMCQGNNAIPLAYGIVPAGQERAVASALVQDIAQPQEPTAYGGYYGVVLPNHLTVGDVACTYFWRVLGNYGLGDLVQATIMQPTAPSYLYMLSNGQTTITEDWISPSSRSFDHDMYAGIFEWLYRALGGISNTKPGYEEIQLKPVLPTGLTNAACTYQCVRGTIVSSWGVTNQTVTWNVQVPVNTTAKVYVPMTLTNFWVTESGATIWQNGAVAGTSPGVAFDQVEGTFPNWQTYVVWTVGSGNYWFQWPVSSLSPPSGLAAVAGNAQVKLNWNSVSGATGYNLRRSTSSGGPYTIIASGLSASNYTDLAVTNNTGYYYAVAARNSTNESIASFEANATPSFVLNAVPGFFQVALSWNTSPGATGYTVKRSMVSGGPYETIVTGLTNTNYTDTPLTNGTVYYYVVTAENASPGNADSMEISAIPQPVPNPGFEQPVVSGYEYNPVGGMWTFSGQSGIAANASGFTGGNPNAPEGLQVAFLQGTGVISQPLNGLTPGLRYTITFSAAQRNYSQAGQTWQVKIDNTVIGSYSPPQSAINYTEYSTSFTAAAASQVVSFVGTDLNGGDNTVLLDNVRLAAGSLAPPASLIANAGNSRVILTWNSLLGAASYNVKRSLIAGGPYTLIAPGIPVTNYTDTPLTNDISYYYVVSAVSSTGMESSNSSEASAMPDMVPNFGFEKPVMSTYLYNPSGGSWTFNGAPGNGSGISANGTAFTDGNPSAPQGVQVAFLQGTGAITQTLTGLIPGGTYAVTFSAAQRGNYNNGGQTWDLRVGGIVVGSYAPAPSATNYVDYTTATFRTNTSSQILAFVGTNLRGGDNTVFIDNVRLLLMAPLAPTNLTANADNGSIMLGWAPVSGATQYKTWRTTTSGGPYSVIASNLTDMTYLDTGLTNGITYYYVVSAYNPAGESPYSSPVGATPIGPSQLTGPAIMLMANGSVQTAMQSFIGWKYQLQYSDSLVSASWLNLGSPVAGNGGTLTFYDTPAPGTKTRFYRILLEQ